MATWPSDGGGGTVLETDPIAGAAVVAEKSRAEAAEATKAAKSALEAEVTRAEEVEKAKATASGLSAEIAARAAAITGEETRAKLAEGSKAAAVDLIAEISRAENAEALKASAAGLTAEEARAKIAEAGEKARAEAAEGLRVTTTLFNAEVARAEAAEATKAAASGLTAEATARAAAVAGEKARAEGVEAGKASLVHTHTEADVAELIAHLDLARRNGLPEKFWWALTAQSLSTANATITARNAGATRFVPARDIICRGISVRVGTAATADHACCAFMYNAAGTEQLAASGSVNGKMNVAARADIDFSEDVLLKAGTPYYPTFQYGTVAEGTTAASLTRIEAANMANIIGVGMGERLVCQVGAGNFPMTGALTAAGTVGWPMLVRER